MISVQGAMDEEGEGFDPILDLNSQAPETEDFPDLGLYGNISQGDLSASRLPLSPTTCRSRRRAGILRPAATLRRLHLGGSQSRWRFGVGGRPWRSSARELRHCSTGSSSPAQQHGGSSHQQLGCTSSACSEGTEGT